MRIAATITAVLSGLLACSAAAHADTLQYTYTEGSTITSFTLDSNPTVATFGNVGFYVFAPVTQGGTTSTVQINFVNSPSGFCNIYIGVSSSICGYNPGTLLFSGDKSAPTLLTGTFNLTDTYHSGMAGTLTVVDTNLSQTPEPSSLVLLGTGALGMAGMVRRRFRRA